MRKVIAFLAFIVSCFQVYAVTPFTQEQITQRAEWTELVAHYCKCLKEYDEFKEIRSHISLLPGVGCASIMFYGETVDHKSRLTEISKLQMGQVTEENEERVSSDGRPSQLKDDPKIQSLVLMAGLFESQYVRISTLENADMTYLVYTFFWQQRLENVWSQPLLGPLLGPAIMPKIFVEVIRSHHAPSCGSKPGCLGSIPTPIAPEIRYVKRVLNFINWAVPRLNQLPGVTVPFGAAKALCGQNDMEFITSCSLQAPEAAHALVPHIQALLAYCCCVAAVIRGGGGKLKIAFVFDTPGSSLRGV